MNKKIDIYVNGDYVCSSTRYRNLHDAKKGFLKDPTWQGIKPDGTLGVCNYPLDRFGMDSIAVWWSDKQ